MQGLADYADHQNKARLLNLHRQYLAGKSSLHAACPIGVFQVHINNSVKGNSITLYYSSAIHCNSATACMVECYLLQSWRDAVSSITVIQLDS